MCCLDPPVVGPYSVIPLLDLLPILRRCSARKPLCLLDSVLDLVDQRILRGMPQALVQSNGVSLPVELAPGGSRQIVKQEGGIPQLWILTVQLLMVQVVLQAGGRQRLRGDPPLPAERLPIGPLQVGQLRLLSIGQPLHGLAQHEPLRLVGQLPVSVIVCVAGSESQVPPPLIAHVAVVDLKAPFPICPLIPSGLPEDHIRRHILASHLPGPVQCLQIRLPGILPAEAVAVSRIKHLLTQQPLLLQDGVQPGVEVLLADLSPCVGLPQGVPLLADLLPLPGLAGLLQRPGVEIPGLPQEGALPGGFVPQPGQYPVQECADLLAQAPVPPHQVEDTLLIGEKIPLHILRHDLRVHLCLVGQGRALSCVKAPLLLPQGLQVPALPADLLQHRPPQTAVALRPLQAVCQLVGDDLGCRILASAVDVDGAVLEEAVGPGPGALACASVIETDGSPKCDL